MYVPEAFAVRDHAILHAFIYRYSFATLTSYDPRTGQLMATHLPLLLDNKASERGTLIGHFARPNPHASIGVTSIKSLAVFSGPHAYITPSWYVPSRPAVPTWNYATVHAQGDLQLIDDPQRVADILQRTVDAYESTRDKPWVNTMPRELNDKLIASVVGFEMPITQLTGKFKLGQNRPRDDQRGVVDGLSQEPDADSAALLAFMREHLPHLFEPA